MASTAQHFTGTQQPQHQRCTCGHYERLEQTMKDDPPVFTSPVSLDASFVHLAKPPARDISHGNHEGLLETLNHSSALLRVAQGKALSRETSDPGVYLCQDCIDRVGHALDADTERLKEECLAYTHTVSVQEERHKMLRTAVASNFVMDDSSGSPHDDVLDRAAAAFSDEMQVLTRACEQYAKELKDLKSLQKEQIRISKQLDVEEDGFWEEHNALELEARAFDHIQAQLLTHGMRAQKELDSLSNVKLHSSLFDLVVDKRGLRYPLINELRLAFRPKKDVRWGEINAAWSQAAQLLLFVGASVDFRSRDWRIVPLTPCAKLMFISADGKRAVYNLGGQDSDYDSPNAAPSKREQSMSMSLRALNCLLDQMIRHVISLMDNPPSLPFEISRHRIGSYDLSRLDESDDPSWSKVIHNIASNLQWLSDRASEWTLECLI